MTITLYLHKTTALRDLITLQRIFQEEKPELVESLKDFLHPLDLSTKLIDLSLSTQIAIQVTPEEFALIGIFNGGVI